MSQSNASEVAYGGHAERASSCMRTLEFLVRKHSYMFNTPELRKRKKEAVLVDECKVGAVFDLFYNQDLTRQEIEAELNMSYTSVTSILKRRHPLAVNFPKHPKELA